MENQTIYIFLASEVERFKVTRTGFESIIQQCNKKLKRDDLPITLECRHYGDWNVHPTVWEPTAHQKWINDNIPSCRYFFAAFGEKIGEAVISEIETAYNHLLSLQSNKCFKMVVYVYAHRDKLEQELSPDAFAMHEIINDTTMWGQHCDYVEPNKDELLLQIESDMYKLVDELEDDYFSDTLDNCLESIHQSPNTGEEHAKWDKAAATIMELVDMAIYRKKWEDPEMLSTRDEILDLFISNGRVEKARKLLQSMQNILEKRYFPDYVFLSRRDGLQLKAEKRYQEAAEVFNQLVETTKRSTFAGADDVMLEAKEELLDCLRQAGNFPEAQKVREELQEEYKNRGNPHKVDQMKIIEAKINSLISAQVATSDDASSPSQTKSYFPHKKQTILHPPRKSANTATVTVNSSKSALSVLDNPLSPSQTDYDAQEQKADDDAEEAEALYRQSLDNCPQTYMEQSTWIRARGLYQVALASYENLIPHNPERYSYGYAVTCNNYGNFLYMSYEYGEAVQYYKKAQRAFKKSKRHKQYPEDLDSIRRNLREARMAGVKAFFRRLFRWFY